MKTKNFIFTLLTLFVSITVSAETWTDANGTEWYFITNGSNATISNRGRDNVNSRIIPSISGTIPNDLAIPSTVYIGETPYSVKSIGSDAFWDCSYLMSVTIPDGVTTIGNNSFYHCYNLTSLIIPEGVTSIEDYAFQHCSGLTSITIPKSVTSIGKLAFDYCGSLTSINVISGNTKYDSRNNCNAIIETSSNTLLKGCKNTVIPASIISIGEYAFNNCYEMTSITIPEGVVSIGDCAFLECSRLTSITIPNGVTSIGRSAFWGCTSLTSITIPNSVSKIGEIAFYGISYLESIVVEEGNTVYDSRNNCNAIIETASNTLLKGCKNTIIPSSVKSIDTGAFNECRDLASITIPEGVTSIGNYAFRDCWDLSSINIPESVIFIGQGAFENTSWFRTQPDGVLYINSIAYAYKGSMPENTSIVIEDGTTHLSPGIFNGSRNLVSISLPESVTSIGDYTFSHCSGLSSITIPTGVTTIGEFAFDYCRNLTSIIIPKNVTQIGRYAFDDCTNLSYIKIPESVTSIGQSAFLRCSGLEYVICDAKSPIILSSNIFAESNYRNATLYVPKGSKVAYEAADYWKNFKEIIEYYQVDTSQDPPIINVEGTWTDANGTEWYFTTNGGNATITGRTENDNIIPSISGTIPEELTIPSTVYIGETPYSVTSIGYAAFGDCSGLTSVTIPNSVTSIGNGAFRYCSSLSFITIPNSVTSIGDYAFYYCSGLTSVTIPNSVTYIGNYAFQYCSGLTSVIVDWATPISIDSNIFSDIANITLYVPYGSKAAYEAADCWKNFKEIVEIDTDISQLDNAIYIEPFAVKVGENAQMQICLKNADAATAYVFDLVLPEGITVAKNDKGKYIDELSDRHDDHTRTFNYKGNNTYSLSTLSGNSEQLTGNDGPIRLVTIEASDNMVEGNYAIEIKNASYSKPDGTLVSLPDTRAVVTVEDYVLGDVNGNGGVDIGDAVSIVNYLVGKDSSIFVAKAADTNKNRQIDIGDAVTIVNLLVGKITNFTREFNIIWDEKEPE